MLATEKGVQPTITVRRSIHHTPHHPHQADNVKVKHISLASIAKRVASALNYGGFENGGHFACIFTPTQTTSQTVPVATPCMQT